MKRGDFDEGACVLRAKIDMASPNINLRDPTLYRIRKVAHQRTGDEWCIYPMYDYAHTLSDAIEGTTHSLCTLEFEDHRPLYDWFLDQSLARASSRPRQIEFSRANVMFMVTSKRIAEAARRRRATSKAGTIRACRRSRASAAAATRRSRSVEFVHRIGMTKKKKAAELGLLEGCMRDDLNETRAAPLRACSIRSKLVIDNYPDGQEEWLEAANHPSKPELGQPQGAVLERDLDRARGFHGERARQVPPPEARRRGAAALRLHREVRARREGRRGRRHASCIAATTPRRAAAPRTPAAR